MTTKIPLIATAKQLFKKRTNVFITEKSESNFQTSSNEINNRSLNKGYQYVIVLILTLGFNNLMSMPKAGHPTLVSAAPHLKIDTLRDFYQNYVSAGNSRDFTAVAKAINGNVIINGVPMKRQDVLASLKGFVDAVPNLTWHIQDLVIEGDHIAVRFRVTGTPKKTSFLGPNPKGLLIAFTEFASYKVQDGRFLEMNYLIDIPAIIQQLKK